MVTPLIFLGVLGVFIKVTLFLRCYLVREALSRLVVIAVNEGLLSSFSVSTITMPSMVSHLLFAHDTLIFCDADLCQMEKLWDILLQFESVSELKISLGK